MEIKTCTTCGKSKKITAFGKYQSGNRRSECSACNVKRYRTKYPERKEYDAKYLRQYREKYNLNRDQMKIDLCQEIGQTECKICGIEDMRVLCFHHRDPSTKKFEIHQGFSRLYDFDHLVGEAHKCDVLCHNCHVLTYYDRQKQSARAIQLADIKIQIMKEISQCRCSLCGVDNPECLAFHHRDKNSKKFDISQGVRRPGEISSVELLAEAMKCDIMCMNCHNLHHNHSD